jgi:hypothetical protein
MRQKLKREETGGVAKGQTGGAVKRQEVHEEDTETAERGNR